MLFPTQDTEINKIKNHLRFKHSIPQWNYTFSYKNERKCIIHYKHKFSVICIGPDLFCPLNDSYTIATLHVSSVKSIIFVLAYIKICVYLHF